MDAIEALRSRRSVRSFTEQPVAKEVIEAIVDCGRFAATAINVQPWEFVVVTSAEMRQSIADTTDYGKHVAQAPVCVVVFCKATEYYLEDGCAATENILVAARAKGLGSCWIAAEKTAYADKIRTMLGAPEGYKAVSIVAMGYTNEDPHPPRRPLSEVIHWEKY